MPNGSVLGWTAWDNYTHHSLLRIYFAAPLTMSATTLLTSINLWQFKKKSHGTKFLHSHLCSLQQKVLAGFPLSNSQLTWIKNDLRKLWLLKIKGINCVTFRPIVELIDYDGCLLLFGFSATHFSLPLLSVLSFSFKPVASIRHHPIQQHMSGSHSCPLSLHSALKSECPLRTWPIYFLCRPLIIAIMDLYLSALSSTSSFVVRFMVLYDDRLDWINTCK